jgi:hypothetical protein
MQYAIGEKFRDQFYGVDYIPNWRGAGPHISVWRGARGGPGCVGATVIPGDALQRYGKYFRLADCEWFIPFVKRLASGDEVPIDEIKREFSANNDGAELPSRDL